MWHISDNDAPRTHKAACSRLFEQMGIRAAEQWKTEAEDHIVSAVRALDQVNGLAELAALSQLLHWYRIHLEGTSRSSLMAKCLDGDPVELPEWLRSAKNGGG